MEVTHELLGYDHIKIIQNDEMFCFSLDSMLLANFVDCGVRVKNIIELGCGNAPIPLFLIVISNPPYFKHLPTSHINKNDYLTIARHEVKATLEGIILEAKRLLIDGGALYMVHRTERLDEIFLCLKEHKLSPKRIQFIYTKTTSDDALLVLIEAKKNRNQGLKVLKPIYCYEENGEYTEVVKKIFNFNKPQ